MQSVDRKAYFLFVSDVNAHHEDELGSSTTTLYGRAARDFDTLMVGILMWRNVAYTH